MSEIQEIVDEMQSRSMEGMDSHDRVEFINMIYLLQAMNIMVDRLEAICRNLPG